MTVLLCCAVCAAFLVLGLQLGSSRQSGPAMGDVLFPVRNLFYLGAYQSAINEAQDLTSLSELDSIARDTFVYRSYIALGSSQVRFHTAKLQQVTSLYHMLNHCWCSAGDQ